MDIPGSPDGQAGQNDKLLCPEALVRIVASRSRSFPGSPCAVLAVTSRSLAAELLSSETGFDSFYLTGHRVFLLDSRRDQGELRPQRVQPDEENSHNRLATQTRESQFARSMYIETLIDNGTTISMRVPLIFEWNMEVEISLWHFFTQVLSKKCYRIQLFERKNA